MIFYNLKIWLASLNKLVYLLTQIKKFMQKKRSNFWIKIKWKYLHFKKMIFLIIIYKKMKTLSLKTYQQLKNHFNHQNIIVKLLTTKINHKILILN